MQRAAIHRTQVKASLSGTNHRQQPRKSAVRLISLPAAFGLTILFMVAMLVFANLSGKSFIPRSLQGGTSASQNNSTLLPRQQLTPTFPSTITQCSDQAHYYLEICGSNFKPGDSISLVVYMIGSEQPTIRHAVKIDAHGKFIERWYFKYCNYLPIAIYAEEVSTVPTINSNVLVITYSTNCIEPRFLGRYK